MVSQWISVKSRKKNSFHWNAAKKCFQLNARKKTTISIKNCKKGVKNGTLVWRMAQCRVAVLSYYFHLQKRWKWNLTSLLHFWNEALHFCSISFAFLQHFFCISFSISVAFLFISTAFLLHFFFHCCIISFHFYSISRTYMKSRFLLVRQTPHSNGAGPFSGRKLFRRVTLLQVVSISI